MRITFAVLTSAVLASLVTVGFTVPALAQGFAGCPPGLAMKGNGCLPPGQAKKMRRGYELPRLEVYQPPVAYVPAYPAYYPQSSGGSLNLGVTVPLP